MFEPGFFDFFIFLSIILLEMLTFLEKIKNSNYIQKCSNQKIDNKF